MQLLVILRQIESYKQGIFSHEAWVMGRAFVISKHEMREEASLLYVSKKKSGQISLI